MTEEQPALATIAVSIPVVIQDDSDADVIWFDEYKIAVLSLELLSEELKKVQSNKLRWKWAIVAMQSSLQAFMVLALRGSSNYGVMHKKNQAAWLEYVNNRMPEGRQYPETELASLTYLYERIKSERWMKYYSESKVFKSTPGEDLSVKNLNDLRGDFMHFMPSSWGLPERYLHGTVASCVPIIEFLTFESNNIAWHHREPELLERVQMASKKCTSAAV